MLRSGKTPTTAAGEPPGKEKLWNVVGAFSHFRVGYFILLSLVPWLWNRTSGDMAPSFNTDPLQSHYNRIPQGNFTLGELEGDNMEKNNFFLREKAFFPTTEELLLNLPKVVNSSLAVFSFHLAWPCSLCEGKSERCIPRKVVSRPHLF